MSQTDMVTSEAAGRYATALFELADDAKALKTVEKDLKALKGMFASSTAIKQMVESPILTSTDKIAGLLGLAKKAKFGKLTTQFLGLCAQNHRSDQIPAIINAFEKKLAKMRGRENAHVVSAKKLSAAQLGAIKTQLKKTLGNSVSITTSIDPDLLGGFAVKIGSRYFDATLRTKLEGLKMAMKEA